MKNPFGTLFHITSKDFQIVQVRGQEYAMRTMSDPVYKSQNNGIRWRECDDLFSWLCFNAEITGKEISEHLLKETDNQRYSFQCLQANGEVYKHKMLPASKNEASKIMREYKLVFTKCTNWKVIEVTII